MNKLAAALVLGYVTLAFYYRAREAAGLLTCDCYQDCWCRQPGLSIFRWVLPRYHHNPGLTEEEKRVLELLAPGRTGSRRRTASPFLNRSRLEVMAGVYGATSNIWENPAQTKRKDRGGEG